MKKGEEEKVKRKEKEKVNNLTVIEK